MPEHAEALISASPASIAGIAAWSGILSCPAGLSHQIRVTRWTCRRDLQQPLSLWRQVRQLAGEAARQELIVGVDG